MKKIFCFVLAALLLLGTCAVPAVQVSAAGYEMENVLLGATVKVSTWYPATNPPSYLNDGETSPDPRVAGTLLCLFDDNKLCFLDFTLPKAKEVNQVKICFNWEDPTYRAKDIAIDIQKEDGTWVRVAEMHDPDMYPDVDDFDLVFNFKMVKAKAIRVTGNGARGDAPGWRLVEIEAYKNLDVIKPDYTGTAKDANEKYNIPLLGIDAGESDEEEDEDLPAAKDLVTNGNGGKTDVGTWYMTYNNAAMWSNNFGSGNPIEYKPLISRDPDKFGISNSANIKEIDMHLEMMAEAKIDFIVFDITNGGLTGALVYGTGNEWIVDNAKVVCERIALWNSKNEWKIKYALAIGTYSAIRDGWPYGYVAEVQAEAVYKDFFENKTYGGDNYYQVNGKPLLILYDWDKNAAERWKYYEGDRTYGDKFTVRAAKSGEPGTYGWQTSFGGTQVHPEVEVVCPGWSTASGDSTIPRENGEYYRRNWELILDNALPRIVMIVALNDYNESLAIFPTDTSGCNNKNEEQWRNTDGKLDPYMYWNMTVNGIKQIRIKNGEIKGTFTGTVTTPKEETKPQETQPVETKPQETTPPKEEKPADTKPQETEPSKEEKPAETKPQETKPSKEEKPAETKPQETKPSKEDKPAETKPQETKPSGEEKPAETKPQETKPQENTPADTNPTETNPAETNPVGTDPTETEPTVTDPGETEPAGTHPTETEPTGTNPDGEEPVETYPVINRPGVGPLPENNIDEQDEDNTGTVILVVAICLVVAGAGATGVVFFIRKKRKKQ